MSYKHNRERKNSLIKKKKKENGHDILEFHKYRRDSLANSEQRLEWDAETLKTENADVLEEYKFLHKAIMMICPLVFQAPDLGLQTDVVHDDVIKNYTTRELAKTLGAVYVGHAYKKKRKNSSKIIVYDYKRKKNVPHKARIVDDSITGRKSKIVDIGKYLDKDED